MKKIPQYKFYKHKYGKELLVDVIYVDDMKKNLKLTPQLIMTFFCIIIITDGVEVIGLDGHSQEVRPGTIICARPGEVWSWNPNTCLSGLVFLFEEQFLLSFFNDNHFLERFPFLRADRKSPFLEPDKELADRLIHLYRQMKAEIDNNCKEKDQHLLRALLYETLMLINRAPQSESSVVTINETFSNRHINTFIDLANENFKQQHSVEFYADKLYITSNYLDKIVKRTLGVSTKHYIQNKIMEEAKRLLTYTTLTVDEISNQLNYETSTYFVRQFSKIVGMPPNSYRKAKK
ncbi:MAG: AraC family transcriptional regulator [Muribaculaceae bacterium]|jgi:AraC family transcriptional regulator, transcriptional activator of pobA|nr:AraC family transcriptional regulator [Muribaculaceae bacterium]